MQMDKKNLRATELAKQMPNMTFLEWKLLSRFIDDRFERAVDIKKKEVEGSVLFSEAMAGSFDQSDSKYF